MSLPKLLPQFISSKEKDVALQDAEGFQRCNARFNHLAAEATPAVFGPDGQMIQIASSAVVTAKNRSDDLPPVSNNQAEAGIPFEIRSQLLGRIRFVQADAFGLRPQSKNCFQIKFCHWRDWKQHGITLCTVAWKCQLERGSTYLFNTPPKNSNTA